MPLKKHKKNMRSYESCFSSTEGIDWLHKNLQKNPNFGSDVTREQTILLLKKLFRAGIIENVREDSGEEEFKVKVPFFRNAIGIFDMYIKQLPQFIPVYFYHV